MKFPSISEVVLERVDFRVRKMLPPGMLEATNIETWIEPTTRALCVELQAHIYGHKVREDEYRVPLDWWEAVKERFAPRWFIQRWPVRYRYFTTREYWLYPELVLPGHRPVFYATTQESREF